MLSPRPTYGIIALQRLERHVSLRDTCVIISIVCAIAFLAACVDALTECSILLLSLGLSGCALAVSVEFDTGCPDFTGLAPLEVDFATICGPERTYLLEVGRL